MELEFDYIILRKRFSEVLKAISKIENDLADYKLEKGINEVIRIQNETKSLLERWKEVSYPKPMETYSSGKCDGSKYSAMYDRRKLKAIMLVELRRLTKDIDNWFVESCFDEKTRIHSIRFEHKSNVWRIRLYGKPFTVGKKSGLKEIAKILESSGPVDLYKLHSKNFSEFHDVNEKVLPGLKELDEDVWIGIFKSYYVKVKELVDEAHEDRVTTNMCLQDILDLIAEFCEKTNYKFSSDITKPDDVMDLFTKNEGNDFINTIKARAKNAKKKSKLVVTPDKAIRRTISKLIDIEPELGAFLQKNIIRKKQRNGLPLQRRGTLDGLVLVGCIDLHSIFHEIGLWDFLAPSWDFAQLGTQPKAHPQTGSRA